MTAETPEEARERRRKASYLYGWGPELPGHAASRSQHEAARHYFAGMEAEAPITREQGRSEERGLIVKHLRRTIACTPDKDKRALLRKLADTYEAGHHDPTGGTDAE